MYGNTQAIDFREPAGNPASEPAIRPAGLRRELTQREVSSTKHSEQSSSNRCHYHPPPPLRRPTPPYQSKTVRTSYKRSRNTSHTKGETEQTDADNNSRVARLRVLLSHCTGEPKNRNMYDTNHRAPGEVMQKKKTPCCYARAKTSLGSEHPVQLEFACILQYEVLFSVYPCHGGQPYSVNSRKALRRSRTTNDTRTPDYANVAC